jgi:hypothetical protein
VYKKKQRILEFIMFTSNTIKNRNLGIRFQLLSLFFFSGNLEGSLQITNNYSRTEDMKSHRPSINYTSNSKLKSLLIENATGIILNSLSLIRALMEISSSAITIFNLKKILEKQNHSCFSGKFMELISVISKIQTSSNEKLHNVQLGLTSHYIPRMCLILYIYMALMTLLCIKDLCYLTFVFLVENKINFPKLGWIFSFDKHGKAKKKLVLLTCIFNIAVGSLTKKLMLKVIDIVIYEKILNEYYEALHTSLTDICDDFQKPVNVINTENISGSPSVKVDSPIKQITFSMRPSEMEDNTNLLHELLFEKPNLSLGNNGDLLKKIKEKISLYEVVKINYYKNIGFTTMHQQDYKKLNMGENVILILNFITCLGNDFNIIFTSKKYLGTETAKELIQSKLEESKGKSSDNKQKVPVKNKEKIKKSFLKKNYKKILLIIGIIFTGYFGSSVLYGLIKLIVKSMAYNRGIRVETFDRNAQNDNKSFEGDMAYHGEWIREAFKKNQPVNILHPIMHQLQHRDDHETCDLDMYLYNYGNYVRKPHGALEDMGFVGGYGAFANLLKEDNDLQTCTNMFPLQNMEKTVANFPLYASSAQQNELWYQSYMHQVRKYFSTDHEVKIVELSEEFIKVTQLRKEEALKEVKEKLLAVVKESSDNNLIINLKLNLPSEWNSTHTTFYLLNDLIKSIDIGKFSYLKENRPENPLNFSSIFEDIYEEALKNNKSLKIICSYHPHISNDLSQKKGFFNSLLANINNVNSIILLLVVFNYNLLKNTRYMIEVMLTVAKKRKIDLKFIIERCEEQVKLFLPIFTSLFKQYNIGNQQKIASDRIDSNLWQLLIKIINKPENGESLEERNANFQRIFHLIEYFRRQNKYIHTDFFHQSGGFESERISMISIPSNLVAGLIINNLVFTKSTAFGSSLQPWQLPLLSINQNYFKSIYMDNQKALEKKNIHITEIKSKDFLPFIEAQASDEEKQIKNQLLSDIILTVMYQCARGEDLTNYEEICKKFSEKYSLMSMVNKQGGNIFENMNKLTNIQEHMKHTYIAKQFGGDPIKTFEYQRNLRRQLENKNMIDVNMVFPVSIMGINDLEVIDPICPGVGFYTQMKHNTYGARMLKEWQKNEYKIGGFKTNSDFQTYIINPLLTGIFPGLSGESFVHRMLPGLSGNSCVHSIDKYLIFFLPFIDEETFLNLIICFYTDIDKKKRNHLLKESLGQLIKAIELQKASQEKNRQIIENLRKEKKIEILSNQYTRSRFGTISNPQKIDNDFDKYMNFFHVKDTSSVLKSSECIDLRPENLLEVLMKNTSYNSSNIGATDVIGINIIIFLRLYEEMIIKNLYEEPLDKDHDNKYYELNIKNPLKRKKTAIGSHEV